MNGRSQRRAARPSARAAAERWLQISLAVLTSLGTLLLGMGERNVLLPVLAIIVSISSVYLTDVKGWLQLNTFVANVAGLIALAVTWRDWNAYPSEGQLLSLANLLIYLQFVLLYRKKNIRNYWLLLLLSLLQVAVAAALNLSVSFGFLLPAYMVVGLITMALFVSLREHVEQEAFETCGASGPPACAAAGQAPAPQTSTRRWPLAHVELARQPWRSSPSFESGLGGPFLRQMIWLATGTFLFALMWFFGLPRGSKKGPWRPTGVIPFTSVGFTESVRLGQLGEVYENPEEVMQVQFIDIRRPEEGYRVSGDSALFRGSLLYYYDGGRWEPLETPSLRGEAITLPRLPEHGPANQQLVREKITIAPRNDRVLFAVLPAYATGPTNMLYSPQTEQLQRPNEIGSGVPLKYEVVTTALRDHVVQLAAPAAGPPGKAALSMPENDDGGDPLAGLRAAAEAVVANVPGNRPDVLARALERYLREEGGFQYSLRSARRRPGSDPVEDFVVSQRQGHCEYFASALTLMLRSLKIPARLALGFKGGEWDPIHRVYQIRELHAHAWVEAYLGPEALPASLADHPQAKKNGAWLTLDPTPARPDDDDLANSFGFGALKRLLDLTQLVWTNYVLGMDSQRQQEAIYQPLAERLESALRSLLNEEGREALRRWIADLMHERLGLSHGFYSRQGLLTAMLLLLAAIGVWKVGGGLAMRLGRWFNQRPDRLRRARTRVEFYEQFESLLGRYRMPRPAGQTQLEFALATGGHLAESPLTQSVGGLPRRIAEAFYRVRFGKRELDEQERQSVERAIAELAAALAARQAAARTGDRRLH